MYNETSTGMHTKGNNSREQSCSKTRPPNIQDRLRNNFNVTGMTNNLLENNSFVINNTIRSRGGALGSISNI